MANSPLVSIIIPAFNSAYIEASLESCLQQTIRIEELEIIVIDDASTDDTAERIAHLSKSQPIQLINLAENVGPAAARNAGLELAQGEYIAFLDSDDMMKPDKLEKQLNFCRQNPAIAMVISGIEEIDKDNALIRNLLRPFPADLKTQVEILFFDNLHTITSTLFFKRSLLDSTGMMNPDLKNLEDMDFALKLLQHSSMHYYPECLTVRRVLDTGLSFTASESIFVESRTDFFNTAIKLHPFLKGLSQKYWFLNYARLGRVLQRQGVGNRARHYYQLSIGHQANPVALLGYVLSFFPIFIQKYFATKTWKSG